MVKLGCLRIGPSLMGPICILCLLSGVLLGRDRLAFRDVGYFYTPLYQHVADQCRQQPWGALGAAIWNPNDLTGMPLAGETTTAVYYPVRMLVYALNASAETSIGIYVFVHLLVASWAAYWMARNFGCRRWSASVGGMVYPLSGTILFLATNPPFLVSAAWLPVVLGGLLKTRREARRRPSILVPGIAMSLMVLGGDPPTAFHSGLVAGFVAIGSVWIRRNEGWSFRCEPLIQLSLVCLVAACLSLPQIAASVDWARHSDRFHASEAIHQDAFSLAPWRLMELAFPNWYGRPWPIHHRWDRVVFDDGVSRPQTALWTPSIYNGSVVVLVAGGLIGFVVRNRRHLRWRLGCKHAPWVLTAAFALLASMGSYTPLYAVLVDWVPGYQSLRYPSKWLPFVALPVSLWTGQGLQFLFSKRFSHHSENYVRVINGWLGFFAIIVVFSWLLVWNLPLGDGIADQYWGPFQLNLARHQVAISCLHTVLAISALLVIGLIKLRWPGGRVSQHWQVLILGCIACDLVAAHHTLVPTINRGAERSRLAEPPAIQDRVRWMNWVGNNGALPQWRTKSSPERLLEVESTLRSCWFGRWHLEHGQSKFNSLVSIRQNEVAEFWQMTKEQTKSLNASESLRLWDRWHAELDIGGVVERDEGKTVFRPVRTPTLTSEAEFELSTDQPVVSMRSVYQDGHWTVEVLDRSDAINERVPKTLIVDSRGRLGQSVTIPPGNWLVRWHYDPWFHNSARRIAIMGWFSVIASVVGSMYYKFKNCRTRSKGIPGTAIV